MNKDDDTQSHYDHSLLSRRRYLRESWVGGAILIVLGGMFLLQNFFNFDAISKLWPVLLIILGVAVIIGRSKKTL